MNTSTQATKPFERNGSTGFFKEDNSWQCTGSMMGRRNSLPDDRNEPVKLRMEKLRLYDGAYDKGGAYWGMGTPLYCAWGHDAAGDEVAIYLRAFSRSEAISTIQAMLPFAKLRS